MKFVSKNTTIGGLSGGGSIRPRRRRGSIRDDESSDD